MLKIFTVLTLILASGTPMVSAQSMKFGVIDLKRVFEECTKFQQVENELQKVQKSKAQSIEQMRNSLADEFDQFKVQQELLPEAARKQRVTELRSKETAYLNKLREEQLELERMKKDKLDPLAEDLKNVVEAIAREEGYDFIFKNLYLAYSNPKHDITNKVIQRMNKR
ncbi:MAG: OmpH family outer membrane protein [bacterium]